MTGGAYAPDATCIATPLYDMPIAERQACYCITFCRNVSKGLTIQYAVQ